jgi:ATP/maltotriose-dependent transcriptional regulator MalT
LILIHAPSGFGKSTLAFQWLQELSREGVTAGWLTIDGDDNNVVWFLAHLLELIRRIRPELTKSLAQALDEHGDDAARYVLTTLVDEIHATDHRMAVVIDDWHRVSDPQTAAALGFLLEHGCHHLQVVVTSWSRAGIPLSKLRIRDEVVEIDSNSLLFDIDESRSLLNDVGGLQLSEGKVEALTAATEGWAAALQLAVLSLRGGADATRLVSRLSGANEMIGDFLAENVLDTLEPELAEFLLATSITERICGGLASALAEVPRGRPCWRRSSSVVCSCSESTTIQAGLPTTICSGNSCVAGSSGTVRGTVSNDCVAPRRYGSLNTPTSTKLSTTRWLRATPPAWSTLWSRTRQICSSSRR